MKARALSLSVLISVCAVVPAMAADTQQPPPPAAAEHPMEIRPRVGVGFSPDQAIIGAQLFLRARVIGLRIAPSIDFGFGDNETTTVLNLDLLLPAISINEKSSLYLGAGLGVGFFSPDLGDNHTEANVNLVGGLDIRRFFLESRFGLGNLPSVRLLGGYRFIL